MNSCYVHSSKQQSIHQRSSDTQMLVGTINGVAAQGVGGDAFYAAVFHANLIYGTLANGCTSPVAYASTGMLSD
ncbi:MAG: hypothetical protein GFH27_549301n191 [Chloroflexi bacterium AL-W]|nr:hypothetical protein [Chloroflexi bacterium AL-N1]NOK68384.1 hypothetical protein [Chloroflexi bacterium AL-N10]NOK74030.1 hypothetical protein [Chloroflexi bacterium AL-N5]NOK82998.1 hypothetical protein [Chloroflexi bacterium AL-W]NOK90520.1 hypothetical protein [Chloroflexi bacterium AL-N15]